MGWAPNRVTTIDLGYEQLWLVDSPAHTRVRVLYGGVWLTQEGDARDAVLSSGDEVALRARGLSVIEALGAARIEVIERADALAVVGRHLRRWLGRARRAASYLRRRLQLGETESAAGCSV